MFVMPAIDMVATGKNIARLREAAGLTVKVAVRLSRAANAGGEFRRGHYGQVA